MKNGFGLEVQLLKNNPTSPLPLSYEERGILHLPGSVTLLTGEGNMAEPEEVVEQKERNNNGVLKR